MRQPSRGSPRRPAGDVDGVQSALQEMRLRGVECTEGALVAAIGAFAATDRRTALSKRSTARATLAAVCPACGSTITCSTPSSGRTWSRRSCSCRSPTT
ncbi:hypothetical protein GUJ93_ZPchr0010g7354 [Zizania palustris]|uniref:Uncharacterized protein n=1 Tax=Zizania palustris TaxID=103762 RepID=A0A8J6BFR7_ZIZPA|nr:hypothetical protein GUJ93_ZPchr0010g7354 [Zizania palustris]